MSQVKINDIKERDDSFSVSVEIDGKQTGHTFPKTDKWVKEDKDGNPAWLIHLVNQHQQQQNIKPKT